MADWLDRELALWQKRLGVSHWTVRLDRFDCRSLDDAPGSYLGARISTMPDYHKATLEIATKRPRAEQREDLVHELCHLMVEPMVGLLDSCREYLAQQTYLMIKSIGEREEERLVTRLTRLMMETQWPS